MTDVTSKLTPIQHLRATVRWISPWEEETQSHLIVITALLMTIVVIAMALGSNNVTLAILSLYWLGLKVFLIWRFALTIIFVVASFRNGKAAALQTWKETWRNLGADPLFSNYRAYRLDSAYLRQQGYSRKVARQWSRLLSAPSRRNHF